MRRIVWAAAAALALGACSALTDLSDLSPGDAAVADGGAEAEAEAEAEAGPILLASADSPWGIAVDDTSIYWTDMIVNTVTRANKLDGSNAVLLANGEGAAGFGPSDIAIDATDVYWTAVDSIRKCPKAGCQNAPTIFPVPNGVTPRSLTLDATDVYVAADEGVVMRVSKSGGPVTQLASKPFPPYTNEIVSDDANVYVSDDDGGITKFLKGPGGPFTDGGATDGGVILTGTGAPAPAVWMLLVGSRIYYSQSSSLGEIAWVDVNGYAAGAGAIVTQQNYPAGLATDGTSLFWANVGDYLSANPSGSIMSCAFASCTPQLVAAEQRLPRSVAVDANNVYWETGGNGNVGGVWRQPK